MAISKLNVPVTQILTTATNILDVVNTSGVDIGNLHICSTSSNPINLYVSIVPTGNSMNVNNSILWNTQIGSGGVLSICQPMFMSSGMKLQASGSSAGLNAYLSYLKLN
jgi:hypothetical protein